jgi:hypothetical protein
MYAKQVKQSVEDTRRVRLERHSITSFQNKNKGDDHPSSERMVENDDDDPTIKGLWKVEPKSE